MTKSLLCRVRLERKQCCINSFTLVRNIECRSLLTYSYFKLFRSYQWLFFSVITNEWVIFFVVGITFSAIMFPESSIRNQLWDKVSNKSLYTCLDGSQLIKKPTNRQFHCVAWFSEQTEKDLKKFSMLHHLKKKKTCVAWV